MTYNRALWLADALAAEGCRVVTYDGWEDRGRPASSGDFAPYAVLLHHTGTPTSMSNPHPTLSMCVHGRPDLSGPLCHVLIGYDGVCHVIAAGRANHAGECNGNGPLTPGDGNAQMIGFELDYSGSQAVGTAQADAAIRGAAAVLRHFHRDAAYCRGHKETSTSGKWDPGRYGPDSSAYDMNEIRRYVAEQLARRPGESGEGEDMTAWARLTMTDDQSIGSDQTAVIAYDHAASDDSGMWGSADYWPAALRPPDGYTVGHFQARFRVAGGNAGGRVSVALRYDSVDGDEPGGETLEADFYMGADGGGVIVYDALTGCGHGRRYRVSVHNRTGRGITLRNGADYKLAAYRNAG